MKQKYIFWVSTKNNEEDCFVVSPTKELAEEFHELAEGFDFGDATATIICEVPNRIYSKNRNRQGYRADWASHDLLRDLGFKIITKDHPSRISFKGKVYQAGFSMEKVLLDLSDDKNGVYIIRVQNSNKYKIGFTNQLVKRLKTFKTATPENLELVVFIECQNHKELESALHNKFKQFSIGGEWFEFSNEDYNQVISYCNELATKPENDFFFNNADFMRSLGMTR